jgi:hypothetical protein
MNEVLSSPRQRAVWLLVLILVLPMALGCGSVGSPGQRSDADPWTYPVRLAESRAKAHELLGNPARTTEVLEEFPKSGITLWFDSEGRVTKINLHGIAGALYAGPSSMYGDNWIPSDRSLLLGLNARSTEEEFLRILGPPADQTEAGRATQREVRRVWRRDGYVLDATFLAVERTEAGKTFPKGALLWFEVSRGL